MGGIREALLFPNCADFQPLLYLNGLADAIVNKYGGQIFEHSQVIKTEGRTVILSSLPALACSELFVALSALP